MNSQFIVVPCTDARRPAHRIRVEGIIGYTQDVAEPHHVVICTIDGHQWCTPMTLDWVDKAIEEVMTRAF